MSSEATPYWDEEEKCFKPFKVSPAYLSRFGKIPQTESLPINESNCMALVAYRPPPIPLPAFRQVDQVEEMSSSDDQSQDGMVMDAMELDE
jgi:hypothetical protein